MITDCAVAAIQFALAQGVECYDFLRLWNEGEFDVIRKEWPDVPDEVFIGADPLLPGTVKALADMERMRKADRRLKGLQALCGHVENGTGTVVTLFQNDATRNFFVKLEGGKRYSYGSSFTSAIDAALIDNKESLDENGFCG